ncbi:MAG: hypothetical protein K0U74_02615 [Alphaproteobacteria bacterium]|nr:hypothetical protein [Alphaproteobacteria bacterium]
MSELEVAARLQHSSAIDELMECLTDRSDLADGQRSPPPPLKPLSETANRKTGRMIRQSAKDGAETRAA